MDQATVKALIRISQAGCGASMIFLAFTIVLYAILRWVTTSLPHSTLLPSRVQQYRVESTLVMQHHIDTLFKPSFPHLYSGVEC